MLNDLYHIDWSNLTHAYGEAMDVPGLILSLGSPEKDERQQALALLYSNIWNQGAVYEATPYAVPFLIRLLDFPDIEDRAKILVLLAHLATGNACLEVMRQTGILDLDESDPVYHLRLAAERNWVRTTRRAVRKGLSLYLRLLEDLEPEVRAGAAYLLACFYQESRKITPHLLRRLGQEREPLAHASLVLSLGVMDIGNPGHREILERLRKSDFHPFVRLAATMALARHLREAAPLDALETLVDGLSTLDPDLPALYAQLPWADSDLPGDLALVLCYFGRKRAALIVPDLLRALAWVEAYSAVNIAYALLYLSFGHEKTGPRRPSELTELQAAVLSALAASRTLWQMNLEASDLLRLFGLPDWPDQLAAFLSRSGELEG